MRILIVRHGESYSNVQGKIISATDLPLTEKGMEQAKAAQAYLLKILYPGAINIAFTSPLKRACQTASIICGSDIKIIQSEDLREMDLGRLEGLTWEERDASYPEINIENDLSDANLPDGEKYSDIRLRCANFIRSNLARADMNKNILIMSHGITIRVLVNVLLDKADKCVNYINWPDNTGISEIEWPALNIRKTIRRLNDRKHLVDASLETADYKTWGAFAAVDYRSI